MLDNLSSKFFKQQFYEWRRDDGYIIREIFRRDGDGFAWSIGDKL